MAFPKRARESAGGSFQKQHQPNSKRHKPTKPVEPVQDEVEAPVEVDLVAQEASLKTYIHHAVKLLSKAIKTSKQFEVQKVARKLKQAREPKEGAADDKVVAETEALLNAIKAISPDAFASTILSTRIAKLYFLRPHATALQSALSSPSSSTSTEPAGQSPEGKARNRLLTNKVLKEAWDEVHRAMAKRCGQEVEPRAPKDKEPKPKPAAAVLATARGADGGIVVQGEQAAGEEATVAAEATGPVKRLSKRAERAAKAALTKAGLPKRTMAMDPSRLAALAAAREEGEDGAGEEEEEASQADDESEDGGPISGSEYGEEDSELEREMARLGGDGDGSDSDEEFFSGDDEGSHNDDDEPPSEAPPVKKVRIAPTPALAKPAKVAKPSKDRKPVTSSAFLPSLASGYVSYSDSEGEDAKRDRDFDKVEKKERKNRRGQRARQAIWEQKYGSGAKHIAKANGTPAAPAKGTKAAKTKAGKAAAAAVEADPEKLDARYQPFDPAKAAAAGGRPGQAPNANAAPLGERKVVRAPPAVMAGEKMHPSWEAKRRAAEQAVLQNAAPQGKKITFG